MKETKWSTSFYWVLRIFVGVALALIVVAMIYPEANVQGPPGKTGATGAAGVSVKGEAGERGRVGETGKTGNTGATGASGRFWGK